MKLMESGKKTLRSKNPRVRWPRFVVCVNNTGNEVSLERGKIYRQVKPLRNDMDGWMRVIDESGEDYLFPSERFVAVALPAKVKRALAVS